MPPQSQKPVWWKIIVGSLIILVEINARVNPAPNSLKANNAGEQAGMNFAMIAIIALGLWLIYSGVKPTWRKPS
jgi:hypothetical protein